MSHVSPTTSTSIRARASDFQALSTSGKALSANRRLDQFYTAVSVAAMCLQSVRDRYDFDIYQLVEPSAGDGVFSDIMPSDRIAIDFDPKSPNIIRGDFLKSSIISERPVMVVGNPPFGKCASLAIAFLQHAARSAEVIGFILPRTAGKASFVRKLPLDWHLVHEEAIPDRAFIADSQVCSVPTIFQIWERRDALRVMPPAKVTHPHFQFTTRENAHFEIQRIGVHAGRIRHNSNAAESSLLFVKAHRSDVEATMSRIDFRDCTRNNAGNPCVCMEEIVVLYDDVLTGRSGRYKRPLAPLRPDGPHTCHCCSPDWPFS